MPTPSSTARRATSSIRQISTRCASAIARSTDGGFPYLVAEDDGAIAGYAYAGPFRPRPAYRFIVEDSVYVAPQAKGRGIGRALMQRLIGEAQSLGFRQIIAVIGDGRPDSASVRLHEALGFRHSGRLEGSGYKHGRWLDTVFMQLSLNGGTASDPDPASLPERRFRAVLTERPAADRSYASTSLQRLVEHAQHLGELMAALQDEAARGDHGIGALLARQFRVLDDLEERRLAGTAEDGEDSAVGKLVDRIVAPFIGGDHAAVKPENLIQFPTVEGDRYVHPLQSRLVKRDQY